EVEVEVDVVGAIDAPGVATGAAAAGAATVSAVPHWLQNFCPSVLTRPQFEHVTPATGGAATAPAAGATGWAAASGSWVAWRNSRMLLPSAPPTWESRPAPKMTTTMTRMMRSSQGPSPTGMLEFLPYACARG